MPLASVPVAYPAAAAPATDPGFRRAHWWLWLTFGYFFTVVTIGLAWDRHYHQTHVFDTFYSAPHLFIYSMTALAGLSVAVAVFTPGLRLWFGPTIRVPLFPFPVPAALFVTGAGFVTLAIAGLLDDQWHTAFGLDETGWSMPHAMIGWGLLMTTLGFIACRLAQVAYRPLSWGAGLILCLLFLAFSQTPFIGPAAGQLSPVIIALDQHAPIILAQPPAQHTFRILLDWNLSHTNPLFTWLASFWAVTATVFLTRLEARRWVVFTAIGLWSVEEFISHLGEISRVDAILRPLGYGIPRGVLLALPAPLLVTALIVALGATLQWDARWGWIVAGAVAGVLGALCWSDGRLTYFLPPLPVGLNLTLAVALGAGLHAVLTRPAERGHAAFVVVGVAMPFVTGLIDLFLRHVTP